MPDLIEQICDILLYVLARNTAVNKEDTWKATAFYIQGGPTTARNTVVVAKPDKASGLTKC